MRVGDELARKRLLPQKRRGLPLKKMQLCHQTKGKPFSYTTWCLVRCQGQTSCKACVEKRHCA
jgi:hypothetical protein